jgi:hypothetical protein
VRQQDQLEPLLKDVPAHAARLAEALPRIGADLARVLRETEKMTQIAGTLREAQRTVDTAIGRWPELRTTLGRTGKLLRTAAGNLDQVLDNRDQYEAAMKDTTVLAEAFAALLPLFTDQLDVRLDEQEQALSALGTSLDDVGTALPVYGETAAQLLRLGRLLAWLVAGLVGLHGVSLLASSRRGPLT